MADFIHLSPPDCGRREADAAARAVASGWVAPVGPDLDAFESEMAFRLGVAHAVALSSGTAALHLALIGAGVTSGTSVVVPTFTFAATANAVLYTGARHVFVDSDETGNIDPALLEATLAELTAEGQLVSAIVAVDIYGRAADYSRISATARLRGIPLVCDGAESLGASHDGTPVGRFGAATAISFNGNKIMTTSGGGMLTTDDADLAATVRKLSAQAREPVSHYEHRTLGYNYRLSNILAAVGRVQLDRLDEMIARRREHRRAYREAVSEMKGISLVPGDDEVDNCWLTNVLLAPENPATPESTRVALEAQGIESRRLWKPLHDQPAYAGSRTSLNGAADALFERGLSLPSGSRMSTADRDRVVFAIAESMGAPRAL